MHAAAIRVAGSAEIARVAEDVDGLPADRRQEHLEVGPGDELGVHAAGLLEQRAAQVGLAAAEALGDAGQVPDRLDGGLGDERRAAREQDRAVGAQPAARIASAISGRSTCALVTAIVGRMS